MDSQYLDWRYPPLHPRSHFSSQPSSSFSLFIAEFFTLIVVVEDAWWRTRGLKGERWRRVRTTYARLGKYLRGYLHEQARLRDSPWLMALLQALLTTCPPSPHLDHFWKTSCSRIQAFVTYDFIHRFLKMREKSREFLQWFLEIQDYHESYSYMHQRIYDYL